MINQLIKKYFWAVTLAGLLVLSGVLAKGVGNLVMARLRTDDAAIEAELGSLMSSQQAQAIRREGISEKKRTRDGVTIMRRNIFDSTVGSVYPGDQPDEEETLIDDAGAGEEGVLNLSPCEDVATDVVATVVSPDPAWSFAAVRSGNETMLYREGMMLDGNEISKISWRYLFFAQSGGECYVDLWDASSKKDMRAAKRNARASRAKVKEEKDDIQGIQVVSDTKRILDRSVIDKALENQGDLLKSARVIPYKKNGQVEGFKVYGIRGGGLLGQLGIKNGDIIQSINGTPITSADQAMEAYGKFKSASNLKVDITRRGSPVTLDVDIK